MVGWAFPIFFQLPNIFLKNICDVATSDDTPEKWHKTSKNPKNAKKQKTRLRPYGSPEAPKTPQKHPKNPPKTPQNDNKYQKNTLKTRKTHFWPHFQKLLLPFNQAEKPGVTLFCGKGDRFHSKWPDFHDFGAFDKEGGSPPFPQKGQNHEIRADVWECPPDHPLLRLNIGFPNITFLTHLFYYNKFFCF